MLRPRNLHYKTTAGGQFISVDRWSISCSTSEPAGERLRLESVEDQRRKAATNDDATRQAGGAAGDGIAEGGRPPDRPATERQHGLEAEQPDRDPQRVPAQVEVVKQQ